MATYSMQDEPDDLIAPALIVSFEDWVDAGAAGSTAARHIATGGDVIATFDGDAIYDFRSHRPVLDIVDGVPKAFAWPQMRLTRRRLNERDVLVLTGPEPDYRWNAFAADVLKLALNLGVVEHVSIGAIPAAVPHTAPTPVMTTGSDERLALGGSPTPGLLRVPAAAVSLIEWTMAGAGIPAVGFWAQVPHYAIPFAAGAIALVRRVEAHLSVTIGAGSLESEAAAQMQALQEIFVNNDEAREYLDRLESMVDEQEVPPAENIAAEVERFLRNQGRRGEGGSNPFSP